MKKENKVSETIGGMGNYERTKETRTWQAGPVFNSDDLLKEIPSNKLDDEENFVHLDRRQMGQQKRRKREKKIISDMENRYKKAKPHIMQESKAAKWLQRLNNMESEPAMDEWVGKTIAGGAALGVGLPLAVKGVRAARRAYDATTGAIGSAVDTVTNIPNAVGSGISSAAPEIAVPAGTASGGAYVAGHVVGTAAVGYSIGALVGMLSRAIIHNKYRVSKHKVKQAMHIPSTTQVSDIAKTLDWFGFSEQAAWIRNGEGDPIIALQNILRALNGDRKYVNPKSGRKMMYKGRKIQLFNAGKKAAKIADLRNSIAAATEHVKAFEFTFMVTERFMWDSHAEYYNMRIEEEFLTLALMAFAAAAGAVQFGKFNTLLTQVESKVQRLMGAKSEDEALKLIGQIVDSFGLKIGKLVVNKKADPMLALRLVVDYLDGVPHTKNPANGYKMATPTKAMAAIPFGGAAATQELLYYIEEVEDLIKKLEGER